MLLGLIVANETDDDDYSMGKQKVVLIKLRFLMHSGLSMMHKIDKKFVYVYTKFEVAATIYLNRHFGGTDFMAASFVVFLI